MAQQGDRVNMHAHHQHAYVLALSPSKDDHSHEVWLLGLERRLQRVTAAFLDHPFKVVMNNQLW